MANMQPAAPDYAALATQAVEALSGTPRERWGDHAPEYHAAVNRILRVWAMTRGVSRASVTPVRSPRRGGDQKARPHGKLGSCPECHEGRAGPNGGVCADCRRRANNAAKRRAAA